MVAPLVILTSPAAFTATLFVSRSRTPSLRVSVPFTSNAPLTLAVFVVTAVWLMVRLLKILLPVVKVLISSTASLKRSFLSTSGSLRRSARSPGTLLM